MRTQLGGGQYISAVASVVSDNPFSIQHSTYEMNTVSIRISTGIELMKNGLRLIFSDSDAIITT